MYKPNFAEWLRSISIAMRAQFVSDTDGKEYPFYRRMGHIHMTIDGVDMDDVDMDDVDEVIQWVIDNNSDLFEHLQMIDKLDGTPVYVTDVCKLGISIIEVNDWEKNDLIKWGDIHILDQAQLLLQMEMYNVKMKR